MIIQNKISHKNYLKEIIQKIKILMENVSNIQISTTQKQSIDKIHTQLSTKIALLNIKSKNKHVIIAQTDWEKNEQEIESLYNELVNIVNDAIIIANVQKQPNPKYQPINHR